MNAPAHNRSGSVLLLAVTAIALLTAVMAHYTMGAAGLRAHQQRQQSVRERRLVHDLALARVLATPISGSMDGRRTGSHGELRWMLHIHDQNDQRIRVDIQVHNRSGAISTSAAWLQQSPSGWQLIDYRPPRSESAR